MPPPSPREELARLAQRVAAMLTTVCHPGQHQADLREVHGHLLQLDAAPSREAELEQLLREARGALGS